MPSYIGKTEAAQHLLALLLRVEALFYWKIYKNRGFPCRNLRGYDALLKITYKKVPICSASNWDFLEKNAPRNDVVVRFKFKLHSLTLPSLYWLRIGLEPMRKQRFWNEFI